jgi:hypothetical protein
MKNPRVTTIYLLTLAASLGWFSFASAEDTKNSDASRAQVRSQAQPNIEQQRQEQQQQADKSLDRDAMAAIEETQNALKAIDANKPDDARSAIERATGKISILTARKPATGLLPVDASVQVIDTAPLDIKEIRRIGKAAENATDDKDYPAARALLQGLISEIRLRTYNLPLASYPLALREAARLMDEKKPEEAKATLLTALHTLVVIDRVTPLPLLTAQVAISQAQEQRDKDKSQAESLLAVAKHELACAKELGYAGKDPEYVALNQAVEDVQKQLKSGNDVTSAFARLKDGVASFFKRQSDSSKGTESARTE